MSKLKNGDIVVGNGATPSLIGYDPVSDTVNSPFNVRRAWGQINQLIQVKSKNSLVTKVANSTARIIDLLDGSTRNVPAISGQIKISVSPDGNTIYLTSGQSPYLAIYDFDTLNVISHSAVIPSATDGKHVLSADGTKLAIKTSTSAFTVYDTSTWAILGTVTTGSGTLLSAESVGHNGNHMIVAGVSSVGVKVWDLDTFTLVTDFTSQMGTSPQLTVSPNQRFVGILHSSYSGAHGSIIDLDDDSIDRLSDLTVYPNTVSVSDDGLRAYSGDPNYLWGWERTSLSNAFGGVKVLSYFASPMTILELELSKWEVIGTIDENLAETQWLCEAFDLETGNLVGSVSTSTSTFTIPVGTPDPVRVTVSPAAFGLWEASSDYSLNQKVYPTDPENTPYYYKCTTSGTTGSTEPTWPVTTNSTVTDGSVVWEIVERIIQPISHSPLVPTVA